MLISHVIGVISQTDKIIHVSFPIVIEFSEVQFTEVIGRLIFVRTIFVHIFVK